MIVNRDALTQKEMFLKERLYRGTMPKTISNVSKGLLSQPKTVKVKADEEIYNEKPVMKFPVKDVVNSSALLNKNFRSDRRGAEKTDVTHTLKHHQTQLQEVTD